MSKVSQTYIDQMVFLIKNHSCEDGSLLETGPLYELYFSVVCVGLDISKDKKNEELLGPCTDSLKANYKAFINSFFAEYFDVIKGGKKYQRRYKLGAYEKDIRNHFNFYYPEIELSMRPMTRSMLDDQITNANFKFILGVMLAVTGTALIIAAVAMFFMVGASAGLALPAITGALGVVGIFSGTYLVARGLAEKETLSSNLSASSY